MIGFAWIGAVHLRATQRGGYFYARKEVRPHNDCTHPKWNRAPRLSPQSATTQTPNTTRQWRMRMVRTTIRLDTTAHARHGLHRRPHRSDCKRRQPTWRTQAYAPRLQRAQRHPPAPHAPSSHLTGWGEPHRREKAKSRAALGVSLPAIFRPCT